MSRQQNFTRQHFGADDHSNRRGGVSRGGGRIERQWRGGTGGERSDYFDAMDDERNFGHYESDDFNRGRQADRFRGSDWDQGRAYPEAMDYGREMSRGFGGTRDQNRFSSDYEQGSTMGGRASWAGSAGYGGYGEAGGMYGQQDFSSEQGHYGRGGLGDWSRTSGGARNDYGSPYGQYGQQAGQGTGRFQEGRGRHRGQMPKGYTRSDDRIKDDVIEHLCRTEEVDLSEVSIDVKNGTVTLSGTVPERRMKHRIEDMCEQCIGVADVENRIRIGRDEGSAGDEQGNRSGSRKGSGNEARH